MRELSVILLSIGILTLSIGHCTQEMKITNLERQAERIEQDYQAVIAENQRLQRVNEQNLSLMAEGGWNDFPGNTSGN